MTEDVQHDGDRRKIVGMVEVRSMCVCTVSFGLKHTDQASLSLQNKGDWTRKIVMDF